MGPRFKYGEIVATSSSEYFMVVCEYAGERRQNDPKGPATWVMGLETDDTCGEMMWWPDEELKVVPEANG